MWLRFALLWGPSRKVIAVRHHGVKSACHEAYTREERRGVLPVSLARR